MSSAPGKNVAADGNRKKKRKKRNGNEDANTDASKVNSPPDGILAFFWTLAEESAEVRQKTCKDMILYLENQQKELSDADVDTGRSTNLAYAVTRLIKGLCSSRKQARQGYAQALAEIIISFGSVLPNDFLTELGEKHISLLSGSNRQQTKDFYMGHAFFVQVLLYAGRFGSNKASSVAPSFVEQSVRKLISHAAKRSPLTTLCFETLSGIIRAVSFEVLQESVLPQVLPLISGKDITDLTPDELSISLALHDSLGSRKLKKIGAPAFVSVLRETETTAKLCAPFQGSISAYPVQHAVWATFFSPVFEKANADTLETHWASLVENGLLGPGDLTPNVSMKRKHLALSLFAHCLNQIASSLSSSSSSSPSPSSLFRSLVSCIFSPRLLKVLVSVLASKKGLQRKDPTLFNCAVSTQQALVGVSTSRPELAQVLVQLLSDRAPNFDLHSRSSTVASMLRSLSATGVAMYVKGQIDRFNEAVEASNDGGDEEGSEDEKEQKVKNVDGIRAGVVKQLCAVGKNKNLVASEDSSDTAWERILIRFFLLHGFFNRPSSTKKSKKKKKELDNVFAEPQTPVSEASASMIAQHFMEVVGDLSHRVKGTQQGQGKWVTVANEEWRSLEKKGYTLREELEEEDTQARQDISTLCENVQATIDSSAKAPGTKQSKAAAANGRATRSTRAKKSKAKEEEPQDQMRVEQLYGFRYLVETVSLLQLTDPSEATPLMEELVVLHERLFPPTKPKKKSSKKKKNLDEEDDAELEDPMQVLVDILLALLARPSAHFRQVAKSVFSSCCSRLTQACLDDLLKVVVTKTRMNNDEEDDEDGAPISQEELRERGLLKKGDAEGSEEEEKGESSSDDEAEDAVQGELKDPKRGEGESESEDEVISMGDALQMTEQFDQADLAIQSIVLMRKQGRQQAKELHREKIYFKYRVLDMIDAFIKRSRHVARSAEGNDGGNFHPFLFGLFEPLLDGIKAAKATTGTSSSDIAALHKQLCDRLSGMFKRVCKEGSLLSSPDDIQAAKDLAGRLMERAKKTAGRDVLVLISSGLHACVRLTGAGNVAAESATKPKKSKKSKKAKELWEVALYRGAFEEYSQKKNSKLNVRFFLDFLRKYTMSGVKLIGSFLKSSKDGVNRNVKEQSLDLLKASLQNRNVLTEDMLEELATGLVPMTIEGLALTSDALEEVKNGDSTNNKAFFHALKFSRLQIRLCSTLISILNKKCSVEKARGLVATEEFKKTVAALPEPVAKDLNSVLSNLSVLAGWKNVTKAYNVKRLNPKKRRNKHLLEAAEIEMREKEEAKRKDEAKEEVGQEPKKSTKDKKAKKKRKKEQTDEEPKQKSAKKAKKPKAAKE